MNINIQSINFFSNAETKAAADRMARQQKRDSTIAFFEKQKENLKNMHTNSLNDIQKKLDILENYNEQIAAAKTEYNNSQVFHVLDEAMERAEKIAEEVKKMAPKTPEERREDMIEEATGIDKNDGILNDTIVELEENLEEGTEITEELSDISETDKIKTNFEQINQLEESEELKRIYKRIDYRI